MRDGGGFARAPDVAVKRGRRGEIVERVGSGGAGEARGVKMADGARSAKAQVSQRRGTSGRGEPINKTLYAL